MKPKIKLSSQLKELMGKHNLTTASLSRLTKIGQPVIYRLMSGETDNPKVATLVPIARHFGLTIGQLLGDESLPSDKDNQTITLIRIPILSWEEAVNWENQKRIATHFINSVDPISPNTFALITKDTTMQPKFPEKTILFINPDIKPKNMDHVIVHVGNNPQATFKQLLFDGPEIYLKPLNTDFAVTRIDHQNHRFLGVVTEARIRF